MTSTEAHITDDIVIESDAHHMEADRILRTVHLTYVGTTTADRIAAAQVHAILALSSAIRSLND